MKLFSTIVLTFGLVMAVIQVAPVAGDLVRASEAKEQTIAFEAEREVALVKACATGKTNVIMHNGVWCQKGDK